MAKTVSNDSEALDLDWDEKPSRVLQIPVSDFPVQYRKMMSAFDENGDGIIDSSDLTIAAKAFKKTKHQKRRLGWALGGAAMTSILMVVATVGLVYAVLVMTKDTVLNGNMLVNKYSHDLVTTNPAVYRVTLKDLPLVPPQDLDRLDKVQMTMPDGVVVSFRISGYELTRNENVLLYTTAGHKVMIVDDESITLKHVNGTDVLLWSASESYRHRRAAGTTLLSDFQSSGSATMNGASPGTYGSITTISPSSITNTSTSLTNSSLELALCRRPCLVCYC
eukprot:comp23932_c8_seq1/m.42265 comp23932_c8_seq1/g.42265  ORF comp23932_c8_seq1/g.42265 comp23932_c8_seq1/m.42265 type:complete len:278 (-) comp23932_c8_seq1:76-909(-)